MNDIGAYLRVALVGATLIWLCGCGEAPSDGATASAPPVAAANTDAMQAAEPEAYAEAVAPQPTEPPVDSDGDGVDSPKDLCPDSPFGEPVDATGCRPRLSVAQEFTLPLRFRTNSAKIVGDSHEALAEVAALMTQYPETSVAIEGHTDDRGPAAYNLKLSLRRADAVARILIDDLGIDAARVATHGYGETRPIATNATKEGRTRNRSIIAVVLPGKAPMTTADDRSSTQPPRAR